MASSAGSPYRSFGAVPFVNESVATLSLPREDPSRSFFLSLTGLQEAHDLALSQCKVGPETPLGGEEARALFSLAAPERYLNHGSYGAPLRACSAVAQAVRARLEAHPNLVIEKPMQELIARSVESVARFVGARADQVLMVPNATYGVGSVVRGFPLKPGDVLMTLGTNYLACLHSMDRACREKGATLVVLPGAPLASAELLDFVREALVRHKPALFVVDHITSATGLIQPVEELAALCRAHGAAICVDGAHAIGQVPLDLERLGADFYVSNLHKWLLTTLSCAFLYIRDCERWPTVVGLVDSHGYGSGVRPATTYMGTMDYVPLTTAPTALAVIERLGGASRVMAHNHDLAVRVARRVAKAWGTPVLLDDEQQWGSMACVLVPGLPEGTPFDSVAIRDDLMYCGPENQRIAVALNGVNGRLYLRVSAQIYLKESDYDIAIALIPEAVERFKQGKSRKPGRG